MSKARTKSPDIFLSLLAVLFIGLKLTGHLMWGWVWVLAPIWAPVALVIIVLFVVFVVAKAIAGDSL